MCTLMTVFSALILASINIYKKSHFLATLIFIYSSAAIMWFVDAIFAKINEGEFFDLSLDDAKLGLIVLACGLALAFLVHISLLLKSKIIA